MEAPSKTTKSIPYNENLWYKLFTYITDTSYPVLFIEILLHYGTIDVFRDNNREIYGFKWKCKNCSDILVVSAPSSTYVLNSIISHLRLNELKDIKNIMISGEPESPDVINDNGPFMKLSHIYNINKEINIYTEKLNNTDSLDGYSKEIIINKIYIDCGVYRDVCNECGAILIINHLNYEISAKHNLAHVIEKMNAESLGCCAKRDKK